MCRTIPTSRTLSVLRIIRAARTWKPLLQSVKFRKSTGAPSALTLNVLSLSVEPCSESVSPVLALKRWADPCRCGARRHAGLSAFSVFRHTQEVTPGSSQSPGLMGLQALVLPRHPLALRAVPSVDLGHQRRLGKLYLRK